VQILDLLTYGVWVFDTDAKFKGFSPHLNKFRSVFGFVFRNAWAIQVVSFAA
jgi:hypothetical protein